MSDKPVYIILAGSNGAGKSTFRETIKNEISDIITIDPDYIARNLDKSLDIKARNFQAGKITINTIKDCLKNKESFIQETTLSGNLNNNISIAKMQGYRIELAYVAIPDVETAISNIQKRASLGGHDIPKEDVMRRFDKSVNNLIDLSKRVDDLTIVNNANKDFKTTLTLEKGNIIYKDNNIPEWLKDTVEKVIKGSREYSNEKVLKVSNKQYGKLLEKKLIKENPFINPNDKSVNILAQGKDVIKAIEKILDFNMER